MGADQRAPGRRRHRLGDHAYGAGLASIGLSLASLFHTVFIAGGVALLDPHQGPIGAHPGIDPLWSTERLELVHDGAEVTRRDKIRFIAATPLALEVLRVCWESEGDTYNCGRCAKCLTAMVELELIGALVRARRFPDVVEPASVAALTLPPGRIRSARWRDAARASSARGRAPGTDHRDRDGAERGRPRLPRQW